MPIYEKLLSEFDAEMVTTRRVIERVPTDKGEWKPHPKSFALGHLTQLVATMPGWIARTLREDEMNLAAGTGYSFQKTESLLEQFDKLSEPPRLPTRLRYWPGHSEPDDQRISSWR